MMLDAEVFEIKKTIYKVSWGIKDSAIFLYNYKFFTTKEKAKVLEKEIHAAFKTLGYAAEGYCKIEEENAD